MSTQTKEKAMAMLPTKEEAIKEVKNISGLALGFIGAHGISVLIKKDTA